MKQVLDFADQSKMRLDLPQDEIGKHFSIKSWWSVCVYDIHGKPKRMIADFEPNTVPSVFVDKVHAYSLINTSNNSTNGFNYIGVTADTTQTLSPSITTLTGEITTNGLTRAQAPTKTHTTGTNSSVIEITFTLTGTQSDITRAALFDALTGGNIGPAAAFSNGATGSMNSGETVKVSITVNIG